ncbi:hypothetical protein O0I10_007741 [Lichtheimia ornata]|uniref:Uncharacterized protein n=1 Tax=Lichtheimia ornata TaxID=688661 RepID=A0AAD7Y027_9FUNG|nr:uncharacterized protein O0I10_007741 [Lichtheimia ornata]KAJ8656662.1 hypothetical protein O0I10_007741 [Lichtheimia ornata]
MNDRWARFYGSAQGMTLISFCLGLSGSVLGVTTLQWAFKETMTGQLMQWRQDIIHMRQRLEIGGGVPYLLRDQGFVAYLSELHRSRYDNKDSSMKRYLQHQWNQSIISIAAALNRRLARQYEPSSSSSSSSSVVVAAAS